MLYVGLEPASEHVAACLWVEPGTEVIARRKMMVANNVPVRIATSFFRADLFGDTRIAKPDFVKPSLQAAIVALGYTFGHAEETLTARPRPLRRRRWSWTRASGSSKYSAPATPARTRRSIR